MDQDVSQEQGNLFVIQNARQLREAISRLRLLENAATNSSLGRERAALEVAVSRYLAFSPRNESVEQPARRQA